MKLSKERLEEIEKLEESIGYIFKNKNLIDVALTHSSYINESKDENKSSNERLEFLGDSILDLIVSEELYKNHKTYPEGKLTKIRSRIVCTSSFSKASEKYNLSSYLLFGKGEESHNGREKKSVKADTFEAFCAAIYLDAGYDFLKDFLMKNYYEIVKELLENDLLFIDYKTKLQEYFNKTNRIILKYKLVKEEGPEHNKTFYMEVSAKNKKLSTGKGKNKKEAEQMAARIAYKKLTNE